MFYVFLLILGVLGAGLYLMMFLQNVPGAVEDRLGALEPLPGNLGEWQVDQDSTQAADARAQGLIRERRVFLDEGRNQLLQQVRYKSATTQEIVRADPDQVLKRRRVRKPSA